MAAVPPPNLLGMTDEQLLQQMQGAMVGSSTYQFAKALLELRNLQRQTSLTGRLAWATWALVFASLGIIVATVLPLFVRCAR